MNHSATYARLGQLVAPSGSRWVLLWWDDESNPVGFTTLEQSLSGKSVAEAKEAAESKLAAEGYRIHGVENVPQGWCAAWDIINEGEGDMTRMPLPNLPPEI